MGKKQDRRTSKNFIKEINKRAYVALKLASTDEERERIKKQIRLSEWVAKLEKEKAEFIEMINKQQSRDTLENYTNAERIILENYLIENGFDVEKFFEKFDYDMEIEGSKIQKFFSNGEDYFMKLKDDVKNILKDYKDLQKEGLKDKEIFEKLWLKYPRYSKNAVKNAILKNQTNCNCSSKTCALAKEDGNCGNEVVLSGKAGCNNYAPEGTEKTNTVKVTKVNKKDQLFKFFDENKNKSKEELKDEAIKKFNITDHGFDNYMYLFNKENNKGGSEMVEKKTDEPIIFEELNKKVVLDAKGSMGTYHIEDGAATIEEFTFKTHKDVDDEIALRRRVLEKELNKLDIREKEYKAIVDRYLN